MIEFAVILFGLLIVVGVVAILAFFGVVSVWGWLQTPRREQRIMLGCLG
jgi:Tfp pilus assembly protein FimT